MVVMILGLYIIMFIEASFIDKLMVRVKKLEDKIKEVK